MAIRVLVLDDEKQWREILEEILQNEGYKVDVADNFEKARHFLANNRYHLAVLDLVLSGDVIVEGEPSGSDLLPDIHSFHDDSSRLCGVVILTGNATKDKAIRDLSASLPFLKDAVSPVVLKRGRDGKGFKPQELLEACYRVVRQVLLERNRLYNQTKFQLYFDLAPGQLIRVELSRPVRHVDNSSNPFKVDIDSYSDRADDLKFFFSMMSSQDRKSWRGRAKRIGQDLEKDFLKADAQLLANLANARAQCQGRLHFVFRGSKDLLRLPLELLPGDITFLAGENPLARQITGLHNHKSSIDHSFWESGDTIRLLLIGSNTRPEIPAVDQEIDTLSQLLPISFRSRGFNCEIHTVPTAEATYDHIRSLLESNQYHIIHYAGHGFHVDDNPDESGFVFWEKPNRQGKVLPMPIYVLAQLLQHSDTKFVFLSCCVGAEGTSEAFVRLNGQDFQGIMEGIVRTGIPAALGYRWNLLDEDAYEFSLAFYENLLDYLDLDLATFKARQTLNETKHYNETWVSPILVAQNL